ncbi:hypothetical protein QBC44DRAFT_388490 [Cladorrhinum sp. PSN332]|nr:hypothetical protein QBC44DRAFT_388490 [Cladorrhinum sp. PSN332]
MGTSSSKQKSTSSSYHHNHLYHGLPTSSRRGGGGHASTTTTTTTTHPSIAPTFFSFEQGSERAQNVRHYNTVESSPLLGRFRAVPRQDYRSPKPRIGRSRTAPGSLGGAGWRGSVHVGYGAISQEEEDREEEEEEEGPDSDGEEVVGFGRVWRRLKNTWVDPKAVVVRRLVDVWWTRWGVLVVLPASLAVAWVAVPFPQYPLPYDDDNDNDNNDLKQPGSGGGSRKVPGHGTAKVQVNFWWFLFVYYGFYNLTALIWITKVFNLYSLNWWPQSLGFPLTVSAIAILSLAAPIPIYLIRETKFLLVHNTAWISWTFVIMAMPVTIAFVILMTNERHLKLRHSLSETQRIFTSSWWAGERDDTISRRERRQRAAILDASAFDPSPNGVGQIGFNVGGRGGNGGGGRYGRAPPVPVRMRRRWLPASFVRFVWFCLALFVGLLAYVIGEAYAEIYLSTLPHNNLETIVYVYGWISTVHLLDGLTGWILGGNEGERVGSYPLSWIFKLYFMLTYHTYVRALYARLRDPAQFAVLQIMSSAGLIIVTPILMSRPVHWFLSVIGLNGQSYGSYQKICIRNVFIRFLAENASMLAFLGSVVVLHFGANQDVYPYFAFDGSEAMGKYTFNLTFYASSVTWACELAASFVVAGLIRVIYKVSVVQEGKLDFAVWPELLPTSVAVILHVLQNMLFSIIRLQFV